MRFYKATFPNGATVVRSTHRDYSHAWGYEIEGGKIGANGFSRTEALARSAASRARGSFAPAVEITSSDYRSILKANKAGAQ